ASDAGAVPPARRPQSLQRIQRRLRQLVQLDVLDDGQQSVHEADRRAAGTSVQDWRSAGVLISRAPACSIRAPPAFRDIGGGAATDADDRADLGVPWGGAMKLTAGAFNN